MEFKVKETSDIETIKTLFVEYSHMIDLGSMK